ncbi:hypothetical protein L1049_002102 [Liquidambar formosana]|uniref:Uncharacterized protein n=1 Tax=Liquidambar formosana TaxID=63359 RepID=A0AAP0R800_LIQFO
MLLHVCFSFSIEDTDTRISSQDTDIFELTSRFSSLSKSVRSSCNSEDFASTDDELKIRSTDEPDATEAEKSLIESIWRDDKARLVTQSKRIFQTSSNRVDFEEEQNRETELLDRSIVSKLLHLCCLFDSVECASALINGEVGMVPLLNEMDETGRSPLHTAAEVHAARCIELLLRKRARTDLKTKDGRSQLALELSLSSRRMDVAWNTDDPIEDLLVLLNQKDLTSVRLLTEKTKDIAEVAYAIAIEGRVVSLAALLMVAAGKVTSSIVVVRADVDLGSKEKTTIYDCVIKETMLLGRVATSSTAGERHCASTKSSESAEKRKRLLCEVELFQLFGAVSQSDCTDKKLTPLLIRASKAGDEPIIKLLLNTNLDINEADTEGNTALHWSLKTSTVSGSNQTRIICLLIKHGARVSQRNKLGLTALHIAAANGNLHLLQILLLEDPDGVNATTEMKETPLFFAVKNHFMDGVELLLRWGANSEIFNLRRQRPIDLAKSQDMRFMLSPTNISFMNRAFPVQKRYSAVFHNNEVISETCETILTMIDEDTTKGRTCLSPKMNICRYFESPSGCVRGSKCYYAHGEEELRQTKQGLQLTHSRTAEEQLKRKIFVGGLPASLDSDSLGKFFEQFGSVEDARVVGVQTGNHLQSRGFGFVKFKHDKSVSAAVQAHYTTIMDKQVEIKSAVPKYQLLTEFQKLPPQQQEEQENNNPLEAQAGVSNEKKTEENRPEQMSWADRLLQGQQKTCSNECQVQVSNTSVDQSQPAWLCSFNKWLPKFLKEVSKRLREGEWYPLSSLKGDFRATCGLELDHTSLGYPKLSDFMRSLPGLCRMKVVPVGGRGAATHMVLLPNLPEPNQQLVQPIKMPYMPACSKSLDDSGDGDSYNFKFDMLSDSSDSNFGFPSSSVQEGNSFDEIPEVNSDQKDASPSVYQRFLQFLEPDPLFHARPWLKSEKGGGTGDVYGGRCEGGEKNIGHQVRHLVLEALARKRNNTSVFFLREFDFYEDYKASIAQGKCFACGQPNLLWANFPCQHFLWCGECKLHAAQAAGISEHKCVICDTRVQRFDFILQNEKCQQMYDEVPKNEEFPPFDPNHIQSPSKKKSPLLSN